MKTLHAFVMAGLASMALGGDAVQAARRPVNLAWVEPAVHRLLFTADDIVRFDWDRQLFELSRESAMDLMVLPPVLEREFAVVDDYGEICRGHMVSPLCSAAYDAPTIVIGPLGPAPRPPLYEVSGGYPGDFGEGGKVRFDPRLRAALDAAGVLAEIDPADPPAPIDSWFSGWHGGGQGLKISATLLPETFRIGRDARLLLRMAPDGEFALDPDRLELVLTLTRGRDGQQLSRVADVPVAELGERSPAFAWSGRPWLPQDGGGDEAAAAGPATLQIELRALIETADGPRLLAKWSIPPVEVRILPPQDGQGGPRPGERKAGAPPQLPVEARSVMLRFTRALGEGRWDEALSLCVERVRDASASSASAEALLRDVVPVERLAGLKQFAIWRVEGNRSFGLFVRLSEPDAEPVVDWEWTVEREGAGWGVGFELTPLKEWIARETQRKTERQGQRQAALDALEPALAEVRTRLTALGGAFAPGEPMPFKLELINGSDRPLAYDDQQAGVNASLIVRDEQGVIVPYVDGPVQTGGAFKVIGPGETVVLLDALDVAAQYDLRRPGRYSVEFTGRGLVVGEAELADPNLERAVASPRAFPSDPAEILVRPAR